MPGRSFQSDEYRYGFQGQEKDDEVKGEGNSINYKYRMHDPRVGRFFAIDPMAGSFPHNGPYNFSENIVIHGIELEGLEVITLSTTTSASASASEFNEEGWLIDFSSSSGIQTFSYTTTGEGIESNIGVAWQASLGIYPDATALDLRGKGTLKTTTYGFVSSSSASTDSDKYGNVIGISLGLGIIPLTVARYRTETTITPENLNAKNLTGLVLTIDIKLEQLDNEVQEFAGRFSDLNTKIGRSKQGLEKNRELLKTGDLSDEKETKVMGKIKELEEQLEGAHKEQKALVKSKKEIETNIKLLKTVKEKVQNLE